MFETQTQSTQPTYGTRSSQITAAVVMFSLTALAFVALLVQVGWLPQPYAARTASAAAPAPAPTTGKLTAEIAPAPAPLQASKPGSLTWLNPKGANRNFTLLCAKAMKVAESYDTTGRIDDTKFYCGEAALQLSADNKPGCINMLNELPNHIGDHAMNTVTTRGNIALACNDTKQFDKLVEAGTAANPVNPVFNFGYDGTLNDEIDNDSTV